MERLIKKCIVPAAGLGTRFLPATKAIPKEMLPIVDTPTIQSSCRRRWTSGVEDVVLINGRGKASIEDHFDIAVELERSSSSAARPRSRDAIRAIANMARIISIRQKEPLGLGHAVLCARAHRGQRAVRRWRSATTSSTPRCPACCSSCARTASTATRASSR